MKKLVVLVFTVILLNASIVRADSSSRETNVLALDHIAKKYRTQISEIDQTILKTLQESSQVKIEDPRGYNQSIKKLEEHVNFRNELIQRIDFIDHLKFLISEHYHGQNLKNFLVERLLLMAAREIGVGQRNPQISKPILKFYTSLALHLNHLPQESKDVIGYIDSYLKISTINNPKTPKAIADLYDYTDGRVSVKANSVSLEEAGDFLDKKLNEKETSQSSGKIEISESQVLSEKDKAEKSEKKEISSDNLQKDSKINDSAVKQEKPTNNQTQEKAGSLTD